MSVTPAIELALKKLESLAVGLVWIIPKGYRLMQPVRVTYNKNGEHGSLFELHPDGKARFEWESIGYFLAEGISQRIKSDLQSRKFGMYDIGLYVENGQGRVMSYAIEGLNGDLYHLRVGSTPSGIMWKNRATPEQRDKAIKREEDWELVRREYQKGFKKFYDWLQRL